MIPVFKAFFQRYFSDPQAVILATLIALGFAMVLLMGRMLMPVLASLVVAYLLDDVVEMIGRAHIKRSYGVWLVFTLFLGLLLLVIFVLVPLLSAQLSRLLGELPSMLQRVQDLLLALPERFSFVSQEQAREMIVGLHAQLGSFGQSLLSFSVSRLPSIITTVVYLVLMPLLVLFFLKDKAQLLAWARRFLPEDRRLMLGVWQDLDRQIGNYVRGKFWEALIVGVATAIALGVMGLNYAILLGALVGVSVFVPYVGAVLVTIPVVLIAFFQWGFSSDFVYVMLVYGIIQSIDGTILVPLLFSEVVNLHPIAIIVAVLVFGGLWGFWGVFFAIPLASLVQVLITSWPQVTASNNG